MHNIDINNILQELQNIMVKNNLTLSTAESCTSGGIASTITKISGASKYFQGGLVAYQDHIKVKYLNVNPSNIIKYDVVSKQVAEEMVKGTCRMFNTDFAIASTGYAGEGMNGIQSGTIWIAWGSSNDIHSKCIINSNKDRIFNTQNAINEALLEFWLYINSHI